jgi:hypothetical protein
VPQQTLTRLPIYTFARLAGINPLHFSGVQIPEVQNAVCDFAWFQYNWQNADKVSREEVADSIAQAEAMLEGHLRYRLIPEWEEQEYRMGPRPFRPEMVFTGQVDTRGLFQSVETNWKHVITPGRREQTLIEAAAAVTYASTKPPATYDDTATVSVTITAGTEAREIRVYYPGHAGDEHWRIRPIAVSIVGTTATITFARELAVVEDDLEQIASGPNFIRPVDGTDDAKFLATVDVYRVWTNGATQATLIWTPPNSGCATCGGSVCDACQAGSQTGCLVVRDPRLGIVQFAPATFNETTGAFETAHRAVGRQPEAVEVYYQAGLLDRSLPDPWNVMSPDWARTVTIMATALLDRPICNCAQSFTRRWATDLAFRGGASQVSAFSMSPQDLNNPFGTRAGLVYGWKRISRPGVAIGRSA